MSDITFADLAPDSVEASIITAYEQLTGATLYPGDPVRLFLEALAYTLAVQNAVINQAGLQNLLAYAEGGHLDVIGAQVGATRLAASNAQHLQRFTLDAAQSWAVIVPAGTRVTTADAKLVFALQADVVIAAGATYGEGTVKAAGSGSAYNGLVPGQVSRMVDPVAYVASTQNVTTSALGADVETDAAYRARIQLAPEAFTCAGPVGAYRALALAAHQDVADVGIWQPEPGTVDVRPVAQGGELPSEEVLAAVRAALDGDTVRPLNDTVLVQAPELVPYELRVSWSISRDKSALASTVSAAVAAAVEQYRLWQRSAPGRDILPTRLVSLMEQAGARRVVVDAPEYTVLEPRQLARETDVSVTFLGVEDV